jgi:hypothetical protein
VRVRSWYVVHFKGYSKEITIRLCHKRQGRSETYPWYELNELLSKYVNASKWLECKEGEGRAGEKCEKTNADGVGHWST